MPTKRSAAPRTASRSACVGPVAGRLVGVAAWFCASACAWVDTVFGGDVVGGAVVGGTVVGGAVVGGTVALVVVVVVVVGAAVTVIVATAVLQLDSPGPQSS